MHWLWRNKSYTLWLFQKIVIFNKLFIYSKKFKCNLSFYFFTSYQPRDVAHFLLQPGRRLKFTDTKHIFLFYKVFMKYNFYFTNNIHKYGITMKKLLTNCHNSNNFNQVIFGIYDVLVFQTTIFGNHYFRIIEEQFRSDFHFEWLLIILQYSNHISHSFWLKLLVLI